MDEEWFFKIFQEVLLRVYNTFKNGLFKEEPSLMIVSKFDENSFSTYRDLIKYYI